MNETTPVTGPVREKLNPVLGNAILAVQAGILGYILYLFITTTGALIPGFPFFLWQFIFVVPVALVVSPLARRLNGSVIILAAGLELAVRIFMKWSGVEIMAFLADVPVVKPALGYATTALAFLAVLYLTRFLRKVSDKAIFLVPASVVLVAVLDWLVQWALGWGFVF